MRTRVVQLKGAFLVLALVLAGAMAVVLTGKAQTVTSVSTAPVYVPDRTHANDPMPPGVINWDATRKDADCTNGQDFAHFIFSFTNVAVRANVMLQTNYSYLTNYAVVTNKSFWAAITGRRHKSIAITTTNVHTVLVTNGTTPAPVTIIDVHPSCGCTTAELPQRPWFLPPGTNAQIPVKVNLAGKNGTVFKSVTVTTDHGRLDLMLVLNIHPAPVRVMSDQEKAAGIAAAKVDRQAVFKGDCATCHAKDVHGKYGQQLYTQVCGVCHEANPRATMVPDLHNLKEAISEEFWRAWITSGKPGTLMPAFSQVQGGPLDDFQIASLSAYLNATIHSKALPAGK